MAQTEVVTVVHLITLHKTDRFLIRGLEVVTELEAAAANKDTVMVGLDVRVKEIEIELAIGRLIACF